MTRKWAAAAFRGSLPFFRFPGLYDGLRTGPGTAPHPSAGSLGKYRPDDNLAITLTCKDGSLGTIIYTAKGSKSFSRERFEVFCEDSVAVIEDFRRGQLVQGGRTRQLKKLSMDMGYQAEMEFFFRQGPGCADYRQQFNSYVASTRLTLKAVEALRTGETVKLSRPGIGPGRFLLHLLRRYRYSQVS